MDYALCIVDSPALGFEPLKDVRPELQDYMYRIFNGMLTYNTREILIVASSIFEAGAWETRGMDVSG